MTIENVVNAISKAKNIAIIGHIMPDGDAIGSCLALYYSIKRLSKKASLYCTDKVPQILNFLKDVDRFKNEIGPNTSYDLTIAVDCSDINRLGSFKELFLNSPLTIAIDHHSSNTGFADINLVDTNAAATGEIVYGLIEKLSLEIDTDTAKALYTAISTDTGHFSFSNTSTETFTIAADLSRHGLDLEYISRRLYRVKSIERIKLLSRALNSLTMYANNKIAMLTITQRDMLETKAMPSDTENIINYAKEIEGVVLAILIKEINDTSVKISLRTSEELDASELASYFDGGGHKRAAGASINKPLKAVKGILIDKAMSLIKELD